MAYSNIIPVSYTHLSAVEIFLNDGETVVSSRIYPKEGSTGLEFISYEGKVKIDKLDIWSLEAFKFDE